MQKREASANPEEPPRADELFPPGRAIGSKGVIGSPARTPPPSPARLARPVSRPSPAAPGDLPLSPGPTSTAPGRRRGPRPSRRGAIGQPGRHSGGRALPTPPFLPLHPPSQEKTAVGPGWQPTAGGESRGEERGSTGRSRRGRPGARAEGNPAGRRRGNKMAALAEGQA